MVDFGYKNHIVVFNIDRDYTTFIAIDGKYWKTLGECKKCGECCKACEGKIKESVNGMGEYMCKFQWRKPVDCALFPCTPTKPNTPNCGFSYQEISKEAFIKELWSVV